MVNEVYRGIDFFLTSYETIEVQNQTELNNRITQYQAQGFKIKETSNNQVILEKKDYNTAIFIILLILTILGGLLYYILCENKIVTINIHQGFSNVSDKKTCPVCGTLIRRDAKFCPSCGEKQSNTCFCSICGHEIKVYSQFCPYCGNKN